MPTTTQRSPSVSFRAAASRLTIAPAPAQSAHLADTGDDPRWELCLELDAELETQLDRQRLAAALLAVHDRHPALRSALTQGPSGWQQTVVPRVEPTLIFAELEELSPDAATTALDDAVRLVRERLTTDGPLTASTGQLGLAIGTNGRHLKIAYLANHLMVDGFSLHLLHRELWQRYQNPDRRPATIDDSYLRYLQDLAELRRTFHLDAEARAWDAALGDLPTVDREALNANIYADQGVLRKPIPLTAGPDLGFHSIAASLYRAVAQWQGRHQVAISHRLLRRRLGFGHSVRRTVGCLAGDVPVVLDGDQPARVIARDLERRLGDISHAGIPYTWLTLNGRLPAPREICPVRLNYTPISLPSTIGQTTFRRPRHRSAAAPETRRGHLVDFIVRSHRGALGVVVRYARNAYRRSEIESLVDIFAHECSVEDHETSRRPS